MHETMAAHLIDYTSVVSLYRFGLIPNFGKPKQGRLLFPPPLQPIAGFFPKTPLLSLWFY